MSAPSSKSNVDEMFNALKEKDDKNHVEKLKKRKRVTTELSELESLLLKTVQNLQEAETCLIKGKEQCSKPFTNAMYVHIYLYCIFIYRNENTFKDKNINM